MAFASSLAYPRSRCIPAGVCCTASPSPSPAVAVILPGLGNNTGDYGRLQVSLEEYGIKSVVARVSRLDWFRNAAGLVDPNYWQGTLRPRPVLDWYLQRVEEAVSEAREAVAGNATVSLVGHSAGGWLARVYMQEFLKGADISLLLTLGTPHMPPPKGVSGVIDQTRGLLDYVQQHCAKPVYTPQLKYVCVAGRYIRGARLSGNSNSQDSEYPDEGRSSSEGVESVTLRARFVGQGYKQVCGKADVWGDGVVPEESAHLEGALNLSFDGVYHSPVGSDDILRPWYGSPQVLNKWLNHL